MKSFKQYILEADERDLIQKIIDFVIHDSTENTLRSVVFKKLIGLLEKKYNKTIDKDELQQYLTKISAAGVNSKQRSSVINNLISLYSGKKQEEPKGNQQSNTQEKPKGKLFGGLFVFDPNNVYDEVIKDGVAIKVGQQIYERDFTKSINNTAWGEWLKKFIPGKVQLGHELSIINKNKETIATITVNAWGPNREKDGFSVTFIKNMKPNTTNADNMSGVTDMGKKYYNDMWNK
jgi:hypothetical protein